MSPLVLLIIVNRLLTDEVWQIVQGYRTSCQVVTKTQNGAELRGTFHAVLPTKNRWVWLRDL